MSIETRLGRLEQTGGRTVHLVVVNSDGDTEAARSRYESTGRHIRYGDSVTYIKTGIDREPGAEGGN